MMNSLAEILEFAPLVKSKTGDVILTRGQLLSDVPFLVQGQVAQGLMQSGRWLHRQAKLCGTGWLELSAAVLCLPACCDSVAETEVEIRHVPCGIFLDWLNQQLPSARQVMQELALSQRQLAELSLSRLALDAHARCADWLLHQAEPAGDSLAVQLTLRKRQIAEQLGMAPETLSRIFRDLREQGLINGRGRTVNLVDPGRLRMMAGA
jgi:CRP-like cAMP-binding protein